MKIFNENPLVDVLSDLTLEALAFSNGRGGSPFEVGIRKYKGQTCAFIKAPRKSPKEFYSTKLDCNALENKDLAYCKSGLNIAKKIKRSYGQSLFVEDGVNGNTVYWIALKSFAGQQL